MKIYICHSGSFDYVNELYTPVKQSRLYEEHEVFLPHEPENTDTKAKDIISKYDLMIGEVSYPSTGQGIELGLASAANVPIFCFYKDGLEPSSSLRFYCKGLTAYSTTDDLLDKIILVIERKSPNSTRSGTLLAA